MAKFDVNPSKDVLTQQMRESMSRILEGRQMENDIQKKQIAEEMTGRPYVPVPEEVRGEIPAYLTEPAGMGGAGTDIGGRPIMDQINTQLQDEINRKFGQGAGGTPTEAMPYQGPATSRPVQLRGTKASGDPIIDWVKNNTINWEARRDKQGNIAVYNIPAGDFGGTREVAGITDKYHPEAFKRISSLPPQEREPAAAQYVVEYAAPIANAVPEALKPYTVDLVFNRGPGGFTSLVQRGLNKLGQPVAVDGGFGPKTLGAMQSVDPVQLVKATETAYREREAELARNNPDRMRLLAGINNRSTKRESEAIKYIQNYYSQNVGQGQQMAVGMGIRPTGPIEGTIPFAPEGTPEAPRQIDEYSPRPLGLGLG